MPDNEIQRAPRDDGQSFSTIDLTGVRQLRPFTIDYRHVHNLQYVDRDGRPPQSFAEFRALVPPSALRAEERPRPDFPDDLKHLAKYSKTQFPKGKVLVLVHGDLLRSVKTSVDEYIRDLAYEGYFATAVKISGGTPQELGAYIAGKKPLSGVLLVGALPTAWFEMDDDFDNTHSEFPCDLYYMDLNGTWRDPDNDGKFSEHPTKVQPEIWVGRLWTPTATGATRN